MDFGGWLKRNSPAILTIIAAVGTGATAVLAAIATPDAIESKKRAQAEKGEEKLTVWEVVKAEAPAYIPAVAVGTGTIACIFGANVLNQKQQASIASAYVAMNEMYTKYRNKVKDIFGEAADYTVQRGIEQDERDADDDRPPWDEVQTFYFEPYGKFFERTMQEVFEAEYHINRNLQLRGNVTVNEFLDFLGLEHVSSGDELGWNLYDGEAFYGYQWIDFSHRYFAAADGMMVCSKKWLQTMVR